jgi:predicted RNase H-like HicB family nuclease
MAKKKKQEKYPVEVYWSEEDRAFIAEAYDLPGCMSDGETEEEAVRNIQEAIELWLETAKEEKRPIPPPSHPEAASSKFVVRLPKSMHRRLQQLARRESVSLNQLVLSLLAERESERRAR